ncbi:hypothetical protein ACOMHN_028919 [Nucella lapillus]
MILQLGLQLGELKPDDQSRTNSNDIYQSTDINSNEPKPSEKSTVFYGIGIGLPMGVVFLLIVTVVSYNCFKKSRQKRSQRWRVQRPSEVEAQYKPRIVGRASSEVSSVSQATTSEASSSTTATQSQIDLMKDGLDSVSSVGEELGVSKRLETWERSRSPT